MVKVEQLFLSYGEQILADSISFAVKPGDRLCLVGRNGAGKSTVLRAIAGEIDVDAGSIAVSDSSRVGYLPQELPPAEDRSVFEFVATGLAALGDDLVAFRHLASRSDAESLEELARVQMRIEAEDGWNFNNRVARVIERLDLDPDVSMSKLSGGQRRRAALAKALVSGPEILLLDEPTNHLDVLSIEWLENLLLEFRGALIFITHDRAFLENVANQIGELDRGYYRQWPGNYSAYLKLREKLLEEEERNNALFDKKLAEEERWIRQGIKARRTRNEGRVRALEALREQRKARRDRRAKAAFSGAELSSSGKLVIEAKAVSFAWPDKSPTVENFSCTVMRGDKIGLIGPNGVGKTTFLKLLLGLLKPDSGSLRQGTRLDIAFFDQLRAQLDESLSAVDNVAGGREFIDIHGKSTHALSYMARFLFSPERARLPVSAMSGGERNRVLLAKLFSKPANLLVLDEPTNDLDIETLELLEDLLIQFEGTLLLVSHDRDFVDNVVTSTLSFEGNGTVKEYVGGYQDWLRQGGVWFRPPGPSASAGSVNGSPDAASTSVKTGPNEEKSAKKLSYKLQRELEQLPAKIEVLESEIAKLQESVIDPGFYKQDEALVKSTLDRLDQLNVELEQNYERWSLLEQDGEV